MCRSMRVAILVYVLVSWLNPGPAGAQVAAESVATGEKITFRSHVLAEERTVVVRLPESYETSARGYPVLYLLDGEYFFPTAVATVQFLSENAYVHFVAMHQPVPEMIVVGIINVDRNRDFTPTHAPVQGASRFPTSGSADRFLQFLETELFPLIDGEYRTHPYRLLCGWSLGGLLTAHTFLKSPDLFSAYIAISPSLWWDNQVMVQRADSLLSAGSVTSKPLVVTLGALEGSGMTGSVRDNFVPLFGQGSSGESPITYIEIPGESHRYVPYKALFEGLRGLYSEWVMPDEVLAGGLDAVEKFYDDLSVRWGYQVEIPESAYLRLSSTVNDAPSAVQIATLATQRYPTSSWAQYRLGRLHHRLGDLELALDSYRRALALERAYDAPDSERLLAIESRLAELERETGVR